MNTNTQGVNWLNILTGGQGVDVNTKVSADTSVTNTILLAGMVVAVLIVLFFVVKKIT